MLGFFLFACATLLVISSAFANEIIQITNTSDADEDIYSIAVFGNTIYAVWRDRLSGRIYFDKSTDFGKTWGYYSKVIDEVDRLNLKKTQRRIKIMVDKNGRIYVFSNYIEYRQKNSKLIIAISEDEGRNFYVTRHIFPHHRGMFDSTVNYEGTIFYVILLGEPHYAYGPIPIYLSKSIDGGKTFSEPIEILELHCAKYLLVETNRDGKEVYLFLKTYQRPINSHAIKFAKSIDYGESFTPLKVLDWPRLPITTPYSATNLQGNLYCSWRWDSNPYWDQQTL